MSFLVQYWYQLDDITEFSGELTLEGALNSVNMTACVAGVVDVCLIPEVPFVLEGSKGLFAYLEMVLEHRGHAVVCVAEGAGQVQPYETSL